MVVEGLVPGCARDGSNVVRQVLVSFNSSSNSRSIVGKSQVGVCVSRVTARLTS
jgi:hypothetical protein